MAIYGLLYFCNKLLERISGEGNEKLRMKIQIFLTDILEIKD